MALQFPRGLVQPYANDPLAFTPVSGGGGGTFDPADPVFYGTGTSSSNSGAGSVTFGQGAVTTGGNFAVATGRLARATAVSACAYGPGSLASGPAAIAIGGSIIDSLGAQAYAEGSIAFGAGNAAGTLPGARATIGAGICIGSASATFGAARTSGEGALAFGCGGVVANGARALAANAMAFGQGSNATAANAVAFGQSSAASAADAMGFGRSAIANAIRATAFGVGTTNQLPDSFAFGSNGLEMFRMFDPATTANYSVRMMKSVQAGAAFTLTGNLAYRGYIECTFAGAITITLDTAANFDIFFPQAYDNMSVVLTVAPSNGSGLVTYVLGAGFTAKGPLGTSANRPHQVMFHRTAAAAYDFVVIHSNIEAP